MSLQISLPADIQKRVESLAMRKGQKVEDVVITAITDYVAAEQPTAPSRNLYESIERSRQVYQIFKERLRERYAIQPDLPQAEVAHAMDALSEKVASGITLTTWEEAEAFMRGEDQYDLSRQQHLPD